MGFFCLYSVSLALLFSLSFFFSVNCREEQALAILNFDRKRTDITQSIFWFLVLVRDWRQFALLILSKFTAIISPWNQETTYVFLILSRGLEGILIAWFRFILEVNLAIIRKAGKMIPKANKKTQERCLNPSLANVPILYSPENTRKPKVSGVFRGYKMRTLAWYGLKNLTTRTVKFEKIFFLNNELWQEVNVIKHLECISTLF